MELNRKNKLDIFYTGWDFNRNFTIIFLGFLLSLLISFPYLANNVIQHDDYNFYIRDIDHFLLSHPQSIFLYLFGRPMQAFFSDFYSTIFSLVGFLGIRILGFLFQGIGCVSIFKLLNFFKFDKNFSLFLSLSFCIFPASIFHNILSIANPFSLAISVAIYCSYFIETKLKKWKILDLLYVFILVIFVISIYQPSITFIGIGFAIRTIKEKVDFKTLRKYTPFIISSILSMVIYMIITKIFMQPFLVEKFPQAAHVISDNSIYSTKLNTNFLNYFTRLILIYKQAFATFYINKNFSYIIFSSLISLTIIQLIRINRDKFISFCFSLFSYFIIFVWLPFPLLIARNGHISFRTIFASTFVIFLLGLLSIHELLNQSDKKLFIIRFIFSLFFISSFTLSTKSAAYSNRHYLNFVDFLNSNESEIVYIFRGPGKAIFDEFFMPLTSYPLAQKRYEIEMNKQFPKIEYKFLVDDVQIECKDKVYFEPGATKEKLKLNCL